MSVATCQNRGSSCLALFDDFLPEQRFIPCLICLRCLPPVYCLGTFHPPSDNRFLPLDAGQPPARGCPADLTTVGGISDALSSLVDFLEDNSHAAAGADTPASISAMKVLDAIPDFIGSGHDVGRSKERMRALGAPETRVIENLEKLLNLLLMVAAVPPEPAYVSNAARMVKVLVAVQKVVRYDDPDSDTSCKENMKSFGSLGTCWVLVEVLKKYLQVRGGGGGGGVQPVQLRGGDPALPVLMECCKAVRNMVVGAENKVKFGAASSGSMEALVDVLKVYGASNAAAALACCQAIVNITDDNADNQIKYVAAPGSMEVLINVLVAYGRISAEIAQASCGAIANITDYHEGNRANFAATPRAIEMLVDMLVAHGSSDATIVIVCCTAIFNITTKNQARKEMYGSVPRSMQVLVDVLWAHGLTDIKVAKRCCNVIWSVTATSISNRSNYGCIAGSIEVLADVLKVYGRSDVNLAETCCGAINGIAYGSADNRKVFGSTDVFSAIVGVLKAHGKTDTVSGKDALYWCCRAIDSLCECNRANRAKFNALDTIYVLEDEVTVPISSKTSALQALGKFNSSRWRWDRTHTRKCLQMAPRWATSSALVLYFFALICFSVTITYITSNMV